MDLSLRVMLNDEQEGNNSHEAKRVCRHSADKILKLKEIFKTLTNPDEIQRHQIAMELELEPQQVKWWFQNTRMQIKIKNEKSVSDALRAENEMILKDNLEMKERLKNLVCQSCNESNHLKQLQVENARLKERHEILVKTLRYMEKQEVSLELKLGLPKSSSHEDFLDIGSSSKSALVLNEDMLSKQPLSGRVEIEKLMMLDAGIAAKQELLKLFDTDEAALLWIKSKVNRKLVLQQENYEKDFPRVDHFNGVETHVESSKDSRILGIGATHLVDMLLDSEKWTNLFPTIVSKAETIKVLERGSSQNQSGALLLMHEEMHVLSPLVKPREFYFLRYCEQVKADIWVIADVSYDYLKEDGPHSSSWRFPSGCLIRQISSDSSQVSWIEHVEVDAKIQTHIMYRDIVNNATAFGAERWLMELQRMSERFVSAALERMPFYDYGVVTLPEGRRCVMQLGHRVVKEFCNILTISSKSDLPQYFADADDSAVRFSIQKNGNMLLSKDPFIVIVASSISLPLPSHIIFDFLRDPARRFEWDEICRGNPWYEIAHISTGTHPNHYVSILQPLVSTPKDGVKIVQECFIDPLGAYIVYTPVNTPELNMAINGSSDLSNVSLIPSGFCISEDNKSFLNDRGVKMKTRGSLLTVVLQLHMPRPFVGDFEAAADASNALMTKVVKSIKHALLNGSELKGF